MSQHTKSDPKPTLIRIGRYDHFQIEWTSLIDCKDYYRLISKQPNCSIVIIHEKNTEKIVFFLHEIEIDLA